MENLPLELLFLIVDRGTLSSRDIISLGSTSKLLRVKLECLIYRDINIRTASPVILSLQQKLLLQHKDSIRSLHLAPCVTSPLPKTLALFPLELPNLTAFSFDFLPSKFGVYNHYFIILSTVLRVPTLKSLSFTINRAGASGSTETSRSYEWLESVSSTQGRLSTSKILELVRDTRDASAPTLIAPDGNSRCKLKVLKMKYMIHNFKEGYYDQWDELLMVLVMLEGYVKELKELEFVIGEVHQCGGCNRLMLNVGGNDDDQVEAIEGSDEGVAAGGPITHHDDHDDESEDTARDFLQRRDWIWKYKWPVWKLDSLRKLQFNTDGVSGLVRWIYLGDSADDGELPRSAADELLKKYKDANRTFFMLDIRRGYFNQEKELTRDFEDAMYTERYPEVKDDDDGYSVILWKLPWDPDNVFEDVDKDYKEIIGIL